MRLSTSKHALSGRLHRHIGRYNSHPAALAQGYELTCQCLMFKQLRYFGLVVIFAVTAGCASIDFDYPKSESTAFTDTGDTRLGRAIADPAAAHPDKAGFYPLLDGIDALALRWMLAERAERSIDVQYFLIHVGCWAMFYVWFFTVMADS